jgi:chromosome segregation ATPase
VWQWLGNSTLKLKLANTETDLAQCQVELEKRRQEVQGYQVTVQKQTQAIGHYKAEMDAAQAASRSLLAEVELSNKARQGRIQKVWGWAGDTCQAVMPNVRKALGLK